LGLIKNHMWQCPKCKRNFKTKNQWHSCVNISIDELFHNKPQKIKLIYAHLYQKCSSFCDLSTDTTKSCIYFISKHRYLVIKPQKDSLVLEFVLDRKEDIFPVIKIYDIGKGRFVHRIKLDHPDDINSQIIHWIKDAYLFSNKK